MIDQEKLIEVASAALSATNLYALESGKEWATTAWRVTLVKLQANINVAAALARTIHTLAPPEQAKAISTIKQAAKDASLLLAGAPPSGSTAEASALAALRLRLSELTTVAENGPGTSKRGPGAIIAVAFALTAGAVAIALRRRSSD